MRDFNKIDFLIQKRRIAVIEKYVPEDSSLLDIGCGYYPQNLVSLETRIKKGIGIDRDIPEMSPSGKISFVKHDIERTLPFPSGEFDCVTVLAVLEHLEYPREIIGECYRILKPGGRIIVTVPSNYSKPILLVLAGLGLISKEEVYSHRHYFSKRELEKLLSEAHFIEKSARFYNLFMNLLLVFEK